MEGYQKWLPAQLCIPLTPGGLWGRAQTCSQDVNLCLMLPVTRTWGKLLNHPRPLFLQWNERRKPRCLCRTRDGDCGYRGKGQLSYSYSLGLMTSEKTSSKLLLVVPVWYPNYLGGCGKRILSLGTALATQWDSLGNLARICFKTIKKIKRKGYGSGTESSPGRSPGSNTLYRDMR